MDPTTASMLIGSPAYIAPERARGEASGPPADLWGLGASLYAAVEGSGPFEREAGALAALTAVVADEPEPATRAGPLLWPVISGLLRKDPSERLDAVEAERMLRLAVAPAPPVTSSARGRRRTKTAAAALVAAAVVATVSATLTVLDRPDQARHQTTVVAPPAAAGPSTQPASTPGAGTGNPDPAPSLPAADSASPGVESQPGKAVPPGPSARPTKPGKGKGKGHGAK